MGEPSWLPIDVRDMLCAQALAVVARAVTRLKVGESRDILFDADDVRRDLLVWAGERGYGIQEPTPGLMRLQRR